MANSSKNIKKKRQNLPTGTHKQKQIFFDRFLGKYKLFLHPPILKRGMKIPKKWVGGGTNFFKNHQSK